MALSFEESKKQLSKLVATPMTMALQDNDVAVVAERWTRHNRYAWFQNY